MLDLRRSTAVARWSWLGTVALPTPGKRFFGIMSARERGAAALLHRGGAVGFIGDIELPRRTPQTLEIIVAPRLLAEDVHDKAAEIQQRPFGGAVSLAVFGRAA